MAEAKPRGADRLRPRRWSFAACTFDEANWSLTVDGRRIAIETKPLELLRELLVRAGTVVSKDELLDRIWPHVTVVEASLPTAVRKLRVALGDDRRDRAIIETVPGVGYRLAVPVEVEEVAATSGWSQSSTAPNAPIPEPAEAIDPRPRRNPLVRLLTATAGAAVGITALAIALASSQDISASTSAASFGQREAANALRRLDVEEIEALLAAGWNPDAPFDGEGNGAINYALNMCEWDRGHDRHRLLLMVRTLHDGGARLDRRNIWGDTPYSIAKADRYCGPNHPVTQMLRTQCYSGFLPLGDRCLAAYELARRERR